MISRPSQHPIGDQSEEDSGADVGRQSKQLRCLDQGHRQPRHLFELGADSAQQGGPGSQVAALIGGRADGRGGRDHIDIQNSAHRVGAPRLTPGLSYAKGSEQVRFAHVP